LHGRVSLLLAVEMLLMLLLLHRLLMHLLLRHVHLLLESARRRRRSVHRRLQWRRRRPRSCHHRHGRSRRPAPSVRSHAAWNVPAHPGTHPGTHPSAHPSAHPAGAMRRLSVWRLRAPDAHVRHALSAWHEL